MLVQAKEYPFHHILIENTYTNEELDWIWKELDILSRGGILEDPEKTLGAVSSTGEKLKNNLGIWVDEVYAKREASPMLSFNRKLLDSHLLNQPTLWFFKRLGIRQYFTLLSYYEGGNYYKPHKDCATATALTWFYREPKKFVGGELHFPDHDYTVQCTTNSTIIFPSQIEHGVTTVQMSEYPGREKMGRYCMAQFLNAAA